MNSSIKNFIRAYLNSSKAYFAEIIYSLRDIDSVIIEVTDFYINSHNKISLSNLVDSKLYNNTDAIDYITFSLFNKEGLPFYLFLFNYFYNKDDASPKDLYKIIHYVKINTDYIDVFKLFINKFLVKFSENIYSLYETEAAIKAEDYEDFYDRYVKNIEL